MKASRSELKAIVKECLLEILSEGIRTSLDRSNKLDRPVINPIFTEQKRDKQSTSSYQQRQPTKYLQDAVKRESGGDKIMESILADTAKTTLASQLAHGDISTSTPGSSQKGITQQEQINGTPEQVFGEDVTSKWANLAFMNPVTKK